MDQKQELTRYSQESTDSLESMEIAVDMEKSISRWCNCFDGIPEAKGYAAVRKLESWKFVSGSQAYMICLLYF